MKEFPPKLKEVLDVIALEVDGMKSIFEKAKYFSNGFKDMTSLQLYFMHRFVDSFNASDMDRETYFKHLAVIEILSELSKLKPLVKLVDGVISYRAHNISDIVKKKLIEHAIEQEIKPYGLTIDKFKKSLFKYEMQVINDIRSPMDNSLTHGWISGVAQKVVANPNRNLKKGSTGGYSKDKSGVFYVVHWKHKNGNEFLKYGISNDHEKRIFNQKRKTDYKPNILFAGEFSDGKIAPTLENACHWRRGSLYGMYGVVSKEEFPDGYTETMNVDQYDWLNNLLYENTMCRLKAI